MFKNEFKSNNSRPSHLFFYENFLITLPYNQNLLSSHFNSNEITFMKKCLKLLYSNLLFYYWVLIKICFIGGLLASQ